MTTPILFDGLPSIEPLAKYKVLTDSLLKIHAEKIYADLRAAGADGYAMALPETHYLPLIIRPDEQVLGSVYGKYSNGRGALFVTNQRILFIDKKPTFVNCKEISFGVVGGVTRTQVGLIGTLTLHTRLGEFKLRTFNQKNAINFAKGVDEMCLRGGDLINKGTYGVSHGAAGRSEAEE